MNQNASQAYTRTTNLTQEQAVEQTDVENTQIGQTAQETNIQGQIDYRI